MFTVLCDLLPDGDKQSKECFYPSNFKDTSSGGNGFGAICLLAIVNKLCIKIMHICSKLKDMFTGTIELTVFKYSP